MKNDRTADVKRLAIEQALADAEDLASLRAAKKEEHAAPSVPLDQVVEDLGLAR
ncbi:MAG: hypothetical protein QOD75_3530 [Blastocatellia bacterium]|jgi:hypothetical protein|nr:hypothetical protein [Blastocatellia bacterium]